MRSKWIILAIASISISIKLFGQTDSLENEIIYSWKLNSLDFSKEKVEVDTSLLSFQNYNAILKNEFSVNYLGNLGSPVQLNEYFKRNSLNTGFIFSEPYSIYFHLPENQKYYNTKKQFSFLSYSNAGPKNESEQTLGVLHTQNISKELNIGIDYDMISSDGRYLNQQVKQNNLTFFSSYIKKRYSLHGDLTFNRVKAQENGGIDSLNYLGSDEYKNRKNIPVKLDDASTHVYSTNFNLINEYKFGKVSQELVITERKAKKVRGTSPINNVIGEEKGETLKINKNEDELQKPDSIYYDTTYNKVIELTGFSLQHEFNYDRDARKYFDNTIVDSFYNELNILIDPNKTYDKVYQTRISNKLSLNYNNANKYNLILSIYNEQLEFLYNGHIIDVGTQDTLKKEVNETNGSTSLIGVLKGNINDFNYFSYGEYFINGDKKENSKLKFQIGYSLLNDQNIGLSFNYINKSPDFYYKQYSSNHFEWYNDYLRMEENWDFEFFYNNSKRKIDLSLNYGQTSNYFYFNETASIDQYRDQIHIVSGEIYKKFKLGPVHSGTRFIYQKSDNDSIINLPAYSLYQSLYFEKLLNFKSTGGKLLMQIGVDYRFTSSYVADSYMPISGVFYKQYDLKQEDYHRLDAFVNFKIKRACLFLRYDYLNSAISKSYYFNAPFYPSPQPVFKFGVSWVFYN